MKKGWRTAAEWTYTSFRDNVANFREELGVMRRFHFLPSSFQVVCINLSLHSVSLAKESLVSGQESVDEFLQRFPKFLGLDTSSWSDHILHNTSQSFMHLQSADTLVHHYLIIWDERGNRVGRFGIHPPGIDTVSKFNQSNNGGFKKYPTSY